MRVAAALVAILTVVVAAACGPRPSTGGVRLDGSARVPDVEGVVLAIDAHEVRLDDGRHYPLSRELQSFNTYDGAAAPISTLKGRYVQLGIDDGTAVWIAAIGPVVGAARTVYYSGVVKGESQGRVWFRDGTTLARGESVPQPRSGASVQAIVASADRRVVAFVEQPDGT